LPAAIVPNVFAPPSTFAPLAVMIWTAADVAKHSALVAGRPQSNAAGQQRPAASKGEVIAELSGQRGAAGRSAMLHPCAALTVLCRAA
jgi:hypothetical protein